MLWRHPLPLTNQWLRAITDAKGQWLAVEYPFPDGAAPLLRGADGALDLRLPNFWSAIGSSSQLNAIAVADYKLLLVGHRGNPERVPIGMDVSWSKDTLTFSVDERYLAAGNNDGSVLVADIGAVRMRMTRLLGAGDPKRLGIRDAE